MAGVLIIEAFPSERARHSVANFVLSRGLESMRSEAGQLVHGQISDSPKWFENACLFSAAQAGHRGLTAHPNKYKVGANRTRSLIDPKLPCHEFPPRRLSLSKDLHQDLFNVPLEIGPGSMLDRSANCISCVAQNLVIQCLDQAGNLVCNLPGIFSVIA